MEFFEPVVSTYKTILTFIAEFTVLSLELIGICIIAIGSVRAICHVLKTLKKKQPINIVVELGKTLALALEFKMGAEIVNTVIIRDLEELGILAIVIALRAILAILIHWEISSEHKREALYKAKAAEAKESTDSTNE